ncbi:hypothetical protein E4U54_004044, partial [Claviceps lovelessii]
MGNCFSAVPEEPERERQGKNYDELVKSGFFETPRPVPVPQEVLERNTGSAEYRDREDEE